MFKSIWDKILSWGRESATIAWARLQAAVGVVIGAAALIDWAGLASLDWAKDRTSVYIAIGLIANAIITEAARRRTLDA